jgi:Uma2 family endonuclease
MTTRILTTPQGELVYPESDGKPMAENTKQLRWIVIIYGGLCAVFRDRIDVFIAADLLWYPKEGHPEINIAPDVFVAFGRPKGHRGSYKQWLEDDIPPQVVFEIRSPSDGWWELSEKLADLDDYGVREYYLYDPEINRLAIYVRHDTGLRRQQNVTEWVSPLLQIRFDLRGEEMVIYEPGPNGQPFRPYEEVRAALDGEMAQRLREVGLDPDL